MTVALIMWCFRSSKAAGPGGWHAQPNRARGPRPFGASGICGLGIMVVQCSIGEPCKHQLQDGDNGHWKSYLP